ncbi:hypothetical protein SDC9_210873 [bioreactor metagenome]|uniref:Uncharacterized protein n=1 Tax=bioreactor metagenome TaxID=1076179 RepID=A0A645JK71_9ZZZZ
MKRSIQDLEICSQPDGIVGVLDAVFDIVRSIENLVGSGGAQIQPVIRIGRVRVQGIDQPVTIRVCRRNDFNNAPIGVPGRGIVPPRISIVYEADGWLIAAGVIGLAAAPGIIPQRFAIDPLQVFPVARAVQSKPQTL